MSQLKHTPGPWRASYDDNGFWFVTADGAPSPYIVATGGEGEVDENNAHLIAAAPELLEALKLARECIAYCRRAHKDAQSGEGVPVEFFLDAAIAKATGGDT